MIGDGMLGSSSSVNQGTTVGGKRASRGQSPRKSEEASNDRGAKEGRDVVSDRSDYPTHKGPCSAARLFARMPSQKPLGDRCPLDSEPPGTQVNGAKACVAGATLLKALSRVPEPVHLSRPRTGKPDAGKPHVRFGWGATEQSVPYPHYQPCLRDGDSHILVALGFQACCIAGFQPVSNRFPTCGNAELGASVGHHI